MRSASGHSHSSRHRRPVRSHSLPVLACRRPQLERSPAPVRRRAAQDPGLRPGLARRLPAVARAHNRALVPSQAQDRNRTRAVPALARANRRPVDKLAHSPVHRLPDPALASRPGSPWTRRPAQRWSASIGTSSPAKTRARWPTTSFTMRSTITSAIRRRPATPPSPRRRKKRPRAKQRTPSAPSATNWSSADGTLHG